MSLETAQRSSSDTSHWDKNAATKYAIAKHGPDGARFLDPYLSDWFARENMEGRNFVDLGAGVGPWSKHALEQGAQSVTAVDINLAMLAEAQRSFPDTIQLVRANVAELCFPRRKFDRLASINVGCNLPADQFEKHFSEAFRIARRGARFIIAAPDSLVTPFSSIRDDFNIFRARTLIQQEIDELWEADPSHDATAVKEIIDSFNTLLRATFLLNESGKPVLITEKNQHRVQAGTPIVRRIPGLVVDNNYHEADEYIACAERTGWQVRNVIRECFRSKKERLAHNSGSEKSLGPEYVDSPPFLVMELEKQ